MEGAGLMIEVDTGGGANKRPIIQERPPWDRMIFFQGQNDVVYQSRSQYVHHFCEGSVSSHLSRA